MLKNSNSLTNAAAESGAGERVPAALPVTLLILAILFFSYRAYNIAVPTFYGIADEHGYMTTAKRLATTGSVAQHQADPYAFIGETMMQSPRDPTTYYLRQPIGYPLLLAAAYWMEGPAAPFFVNPLLGVALLFAVYVLGKELGSRLAGAITAVVLAAHPLVLYYTLTALSHIPDMATAAWCVALALVWRREQKLWQAVVAGILAGVAIEIRYTNVLLVLPLAVVLIDRWRMERRRASIHVAAALGVGGAIVALVPLLIYQTVAFGSPLRTGYSAGGNATSFSISWLVAHAPAMAEILYWPGTGLSVLLVALAAGIVVLAWRGRFALALLLAWGLPPLLLYTAYYGMPANNVLLYARFALSSFPPLILLALIWPAYVKAGRAVWMGITGSVALVAIGLSLSSPFLKESLEALNDNMLFNYAAAGIVTKGAPPHSVILADVFTQYFLDYVDDYVIYTPDMYNREHLDKRLADLQRTPREFDPARTRQLAALLGNKSDEELMGILRTQLARYAGKGTPVYLVTLKMREPIWAGLLRAGLHPIDSTLGGNAVLYRLDFPSTTRP